MQLKYKNGDALKKNEAIDVDLDKKDSKKKELKKLENALLFDTREKSTRDKLVSKYKSAQERELEEQRIKLQKALEGKTVLRSALDVGKKKQRTSSMSSLSSGSDIPEFVDKIVKTERLSSERNAMLKKGMSHRL